MLSSLPPLLPLARNIQNERFQADQRPEKVWLATGVFRNEKGETPLLECVREAEKSIIEAETSKDYTPFVGAPQFCSAVQTLIFGDERVGDDGKGNKRIATAQTPGGTAALRMAGELLSRFSPPPTLWLPNPSWGNHVTIFQAVGLEVKRFGYPRDLHGGLDFECLVSSLVKEVPRGDAILFHACCHNPTGADPTAEQWQRLGEMCKARGWFPVFDCAFLGYGHGIEEDLVGIRTFVSCKLDMLVCLSLSKSFEIYCERVGSISIVSQTPEHCQHAFNHLQHSIRATWSRPPAHGAAIVTTILTTPHLRSSWVESVGKIRKRVLRMRKLVVEGLVEMGYPLSLVSSSLDVTGVFLDLGLTSQQRRRMEEEHAFYCSSSGWLNVVALKEEEVHRFCRALVLVSEEKMKEEEVKGRKKGGGKGEKKEEKESSSNGTIFQSPL